MNYGFVINNDDCIGCHACSTACKSENDVPLGVNRTWVKSIEKGHFPHVARSFQVTRCNHCANPPCVRICPVEAMYQREDGIVEFSSDACIGCKACLQACPYDAIYVDPESGTAAKCHYCAHRVEVGLEPACVVVCPEHAIIAGDLDDPGSEISRILGRERVTVRKPEQGTSPKLYYIGGDDVAMHPTGANAAANSYAWVDVHDDRNVAAASNLKAKQGVPAGNVINIADGRMADQMTQVVFNAQHHIPWHWPVPAYLVTKSIAAGLFALLAAIWFLDRNVVAEHLYLPASIVALVFLLVTTALLVIDLERPERFLRILTRPQWRSWLTRGAVILVAFSLITTAWVAIELATTFDWIDRANTPGLRTLVFLPGIPLAVGTAIYTAFLFGQAEGRDLWQSPLLPIHLMVQGVMAGSAVGMLLALGEPQSSFGMIMRTVFIASLITDLAVILLGEFGMPHSSDNAARAAKMITSGKYKTTYRWGVLVLGHLIPIVIAIFVQNAPALAVAAIAALIGLYAYEHVFVTAPQEIPNS